MTLENNNLKKKLTDNSFEELYQNTEDFQKLNCAKNTEEVLEILNKYGYNGNSETLTREVLELLNEININDLKNVSGGKSLGKKLGHKLGGPALALLAGLTPIVGVNATTASDVQLTTTALEAKLLDQALSEAKKNKKKHSPSLLLPIIQHALEIGVPPVLTLLINHFRSNVAHTAVNETFEKQLAYLEEEYESIKDSLYNRFDCTKEHSKRFVVFVYNLISLLNSEQQLQKSSGGLMIWFTETMNSLDAFHNQTNILLLIIAKFLNIEIDTEEPKLDPQSLTDKISDTLYPFIEKIIQDIDKTKSQMLTAQNVLRYDTEEKVSDALKECAGLQLVKDEKTGDYHLDKSNYPTLTEALSFFNHQVKKGEMFDRNGNPVVTMILYNQAVQYPEDQENDYNLDNLF